MSSRIQHEIKSTKDKVSIFTARGWVSGSGGVAGIPDMTGSVIETTDPGLSVIYGSGSLSQPSGSMRLTLSTNNKYPEILSYHVSCKGSGTLLSNFAGTTGDQLLSVPDNFEVRIRDVGTGSIDFGFVTQRMSSSLGAMLGTGHFVGAVPADTAHSTSPAIEWTATIVYRNTNR